MPQFVLSLTILENFKAVVLDRYTLALVLIPISFYSRKTLNNICSLKFLHLNGWPQIVPYRVHVKISY